MSKPIAIGVILFVLGIIVGRASVIASGPSTSAPASSVAMPSAMPFAQPAPTAALTGAGKGEVLRGKVAEVIQVPQYTYLRMESGEWAAVESMPSLTAGQEVGVMLQTEMHDFSSPSLGRTFASLWFGSIEGAAPGPRTAQAAAPVPMAGPAPTATPEVKAALQAAGSGEALTLRVVDVYSERAMLGGRKVKVKGTVDRASLVQGAWYVHLKDGTGAAADKTDDLLCISATEVKKDQAVVMEGIVALNKDVGMGPVPVSLDQAQAK